MGAHRWVFVVAVAALAACGRQAATLVPRDGLLVLELGGGNPSLRAELERRGVALATSRSWRQVALPGDPVPAVIPAPSTDDAGPSAADPGTGPAPDDAGGNGATPTPVTEAGWFEVRLGKRETLMHLAKKHLGKSARFPEIMALNGWTDAQARRLAEGQVVKIPRDRKRP